jgi:hypothetical protein
MVFNFTDKHQFSTRLNLNDESLEIVKYAKLLGVVVSDNLKWDENTTYLVKRANSRMELLRKVTSFGTSIEEKKNICILYIRSILEQSCVVWHSSLTAENAQELERIQKAAVRIILGKNFENYEEALDRIDLQPLNVRREELCLKFAIKSLKNPKVRDIFPKREKSPEMLLRDEEKFVVKHANTERMKQSAIPYMQGLLNAYYQKTVE